MLVADYSVTWPNNTALFPYIPVDLYYFRRNKYYHPSDYFYDSHDNTLSTTNVELIQSYFLLNCHYITHATGNTTTNKVTFLTTSYLINMLF